MTKVDKSQYTKTEWHKIREDRRRQKESNPETTKNPPAFVLGNGVSRQSVDVDDLLPAGTVYGCNALYRTHSPHYLVAVDPKMVNEICKNQYHLEHEVWTNPNKSFGHYRNLNFFRPSRGWSSGPTALLLASRNAHDTVYILGFDYQGLNNGATLNNIYASTQNYKSKGDNATFYGNWLRQTRTVISENPDITFIRIVDTDAFRPPELNNFNNFKTIFMENFKKILQNL